MQENENISLSEPFFFLTLFPLEFSIFSDIKEESIQILAISLNTC